MCSKSITVFSEAGKYLGTQVFNGDPQVNDVFIVQPTEGEAALAKVVMRRWAYNGRLELIVAPELIFSEKD